MACIFARSVFVFSSDVEPFAEDFQRSLVAGILPNRVVLTNFEKATSMSKGATPVNSSLIKPVAISILVCLCAGPSLFAQQQMQGERVTPSTPEQIVESIYQLVSSEAGKTPDWNVVRSLFLENSVVVLRVTRDSTAVFSLQGFIDDFVRFYGIPAVQKNGFTEKVIRMKPMVMGNIAHILVLYEAHIPGTPRPPQRGVDSWELVRRGEKWLIVSVTNEIPTKDRPLPKDLQE
jgi:hypothetical protein